MVRRLLYLNGVCIAFVILFHATGMGFVSMFAWMERYVSIFQPGYNPIGTPAYYVLRFFEQIAVWVIPAFLFISGYFIAFSYGKGNDYRKGWFAALTRSKDLLIPYLFWSIIVLVLAFVEGMRYSPATLVRMILTGSANPVFYYIPLLIQFFILSPLLVFLARKNWKALLIGSAVIQLLVVASQYPVFLGNQDSALREMIRWVPNWFFLSRILWFTAGIVIGFHPTPFKEFIANTKWILLAAALLCIPIGIWEWETYYRLSGLEWLDHRETFIDTIYSAALILSYLAFDQIKWPLKEQLSKLGVHSFAIYLTHSLFITYTARIIYLLAGRLDIFKYFLGYQVLLQPILILVGLFGPLLIIWFVEKTPANKFYKYILG